MKKLIFAAMILMSTQLIAQQSLKNKSVRSHESANTGYLAVTSTYSSFNGKSAVFTGGYGGWMINHKLMIGVGGYGLTTRQKGYGLNAQTHEQNYYKMGYGGLMVEYTFFGDKMIHLTANTLVGGGFIKNGHGKGTKPENGSDELKDIDASGFYVVQPSVNVEVSVLEWLRVSAGGGYRFIAGVDQPGITNAKMSAPTANLTLKFGIF